MSVICFAMYAFLVTMVVRAILSWVRPSGGPLAMVDMVAGRITEPVLGPVRRRVPPIRLGSIALDAAFLVVLLGVGRVGTAVFCA